MKKATIEPIPEDAVPFSRGYHAITPDAKVYRIVPNMGTWVGRRLYGSKKDGLHRLSSDGETLLVNARRAAAYIFGDAARISDTGDDRR